MMLCEVFDYKVDLEDTIDESQSTVTLSKVCWVMCSQQQPSDVAACVIVLETK